MDMGDLKLHGFGSIGKVRGVLSSREIDIGDFSLLG